MKWFIIFFLFLIPFVSAVTIQDTTFFSQISNDTIYINQSITVGNFTVESETIIIYDLSTTGVFNNTNSTYSSTVEFFNLVTESYTFDLRWDNGTIIENLDDNVSITALANQFYVLQKNTISTQQGGGPTGGGPGSSGFVSNLKNFTAEVPTIWSKNTNNIINITFYDSFGYFFDPETDPTFEFSKNDFNLESYTRKSQGNYEAIFSVKDIAVGNYELTIKAQNGGIITEKYNFEVEEVITEEITIDKIENLIDESKEKINSFFTNTRSWVNNFFNKLDLKNKLKEPKYLLLYIFVPIIAILIITILLWMAHSVKKLKNEKN